MTSVSNTIPEGFEAVRLIHGGLTDDPAGGKPWAAPKPIKSVLPRVEKMRPELLPQALHYVFDIADRQNSPSDFSAVTALCAAGAIVGNRMKIAPKSHDDWAVVPNLWGGIVGRPSAMKSPAMVSSLSALYGIQDAMREQWEAGNKEQKLDARLSSLDAKKAQREAKKAMDAGNRDAAREKLAAMDADDDEERPCPRIVVNDATVEKLGELLNENPRGLLLVRDELPGFLARLESEDYQSERAFYLEAYNGDGRFTYDRIGRGTVHIRSATLSIIGGIQPSRIAPIVRGALTGATNDGLIQRLQLAVWPDDKKEWTWVDRRPSKELREAYDQAFADLHDRLPGSAADPTVMRFSATAQDMFREFMTAINQEAIAGSLSSVMESHILKMPKTIASLALLFELIDSGRFEVGEAATARALLWVSYLRSHAERLYAAGEVMAEDGARLILSRRGQLPNPFTGRAVHKKDWAGLSDKDAVDAALDVLVATNHCREVEQPAHPMGGRPTTLYRWNPQLEQSK